MDEISDFLSILKRRLEKVKKNQLPKHLFQLDEAYWKYRKGKQDLNSFLKLLKREMQRRELILPKVLKDYTRLMDFSMKMDSKKLDTEIRTLVDQISKSLTKDDIKKFLKVVMKYRLGKETEIGFVRALRTWSAKKDLDLSKFLQFQRYSESLELQSKISLRHLKSTLENLTVRILSQHAQELFEKTLRWQQLEDLLMLKLSSSDWEELAHRDLLDYFSFLTKDSVFLNKTSLSLKKWLHRSKPFYEMAQRRNEILLQKTLGFMKKRNFSSVMMITGGFHTEGIKQEIRRRGFSYAVILPAAKNVDSTHYQDRLLIHSSGFDMLFLESMKPSISAKRIGPLEHSLAPALRTAVEPFYPWLRPLILKKAFLFYALLAFWESGIRPSQMSLSEARTRLLSCVHDTEKESLKEFLDSLEMGSIGNRGRGEVWLKGRIAEKEWVFVLGKNLKTSQLNVKPAAEGLLKKREGVSFIVFQAQGKIFAEVKKVSISSPWARMGTWFKEIWGKTRDLLSNRYGWAGVAGLGSGLNFILLYGYAMIANPSYRFGLDFLSELGVGPVSWPFNLSLMMSGIFLMVFSWLSLRPLLKPGKATDVGLALLSLSGFFLACVGAFPANLGLVHVVVAAAFFGLISLALLLLAKPMAQSPVFGSSIAAGALMTVFLSILLLVTLSPAVETAVVLAHFFGIYLTSLKLLKAGMASLKEKTVLSSESFKDELLWWMIYAKDNETAKVAEKLYLSLTDDFAFNLWGKRLTQKALAQRIDDTLLGPGISADRIDQKVKDAFENGSGLVMLMPLDIPVAAESLKKRNAKGIKLGAVVGFPLSGLTQTKLLETEYALKHGATEIDMVLDHAALVRGQDEEVLKDIRAVVQKAKAAGGSKILVKVIIETGILTEEEKIRAARLVRESGAESVKTSTGFFGGATVQDVALLRLISGPDFMVKASGGIQKLDDAKNMIESGADRLGVSKSAAVLAGFPKDGKILIGANQAKDLLKRIRELREKVMKRGLQAFTKRIEAYGSERREVETEKTEKMDRNMLEKTRKIDLPSRINLVNLRPKLARPDLEEMAELMHQYRFRAAIVSPIHVEELAQLFRERGMHQPIIAVVGFPFNTLTQAKEFEVKYSIEAGANGIKMVMDVASLRRGIPEKTLEDLRRIVDTAKSASNGKVQIDIILDAALLREGLSQSEGDRLVREAAKMIFQSGADGMSLNTGWKGKAELGDIRLVREIVGRDFRVTASGGVKTLKNTMELLEAGADQVSSSDVQEIVLEYVEAMKAGPKDFPKEKLEMWEIAA
jgi:deoxyribose-phosphate aldolase